MSYFDQRALLQAGLPLHVVETLREMYNRTGGSADTVLTLAEIESLILEAPNNAEVTARLRATVEHLVARFSAQPVKSTRDIERRIEQLELANEQFSAGRRDLLRRIENLETLNATLTRSRHDLLRRLEQLEAITA